MDVANPWIIAHYLPQILLCVNTDKGLTLLDLSDDSQYLASRASDR